MTIHFVVHDEADSVGVVVVEGLKARTRLNGWIMDQDRMMEFDAKSDIPIGHKLAIREIRSGDAIIKYGVDIGPRRCRHRPGRAPARPQRQDQALVGEPLPWA
jgi:(2R)-sulfolactate sulfo-lyase subunit alpha